MKFYTWYYDENTNWYMFIMNIHLTEAEYDYSGFSIDEKNRITYDEFGEDYRKLNKIEQNPKNYKSFYIFMIKTIFEVKNEC